MSAAISSALVDLANTREHCCCALGNIVVTRSLSAPDDAYLKRWVSAVLDHGKKHPQGLGVLVLIDACAAPPGEAQRIAIKNAYVSLRGVVRGAVQVVKGEGFAAAAKRSLLTVINLATGIGYPIKVTGNVVEAASALRKVLGNALDPSVDATLLGEVAGSVRSRLALDASSQ
jgi:hypothetical protein